MLNRNNNQFAKYIDAIKKKLDENLNFVKAVSGKEKSFNIDYLRDRRNSIDKASGT